MRVKKRRIIDEEGKLRQKERMRGKEGRMIRAKEEAEGGYKMKWVGLQCVS